MSTNCLILKTNCELLCETEEARRRKCEKDGENNIEDGKKEKVGKPDGREGTRMRNTLCREETEYCTMREEVKTTVCRRCFS